MVAYDKRPLNRLNEIEQISNIVPPSDGRVIVNVVVVAAVALLITDKSFHIIIIELLRTDTYRRPHTQAIYWRQVNR